MADKTEKTKKTEKGDRTSKKSGVLTLVKAIAFISVVVLLEIAAASMLVPTEKETAIIANRLAAADASKDVNKEGNSTGEETMLAPTDMREVALGSYHVVTYDPNTGASLNVDFELFGTVLEDDEGEFYSLFGTNGSRIREQVLIAVRTMEVTDLTDPTLGLIKRKILEKTNRALSKPLLHEAIFSKFSFVER